MSSVSIQTDPFDAKSKYNLTADEAEVLRLYQMQDLEGRTEILHTAYEQKRRLAQDAVCADRGEQIAAEAQEIIQNDAVRKEG